MRIGLLGLAFNSSNLGCQALGYGFLNILESISIHEGFDIEVLVFNDVDSNKIKSIGNYEKLIIMTKKLPGYKKIKYHSEMISDFKKCDVVFDFTAGDSFSDIYGLNRFLRQTYAKFLVIKSKTPLILGSQTYGPYKSFIAKKFAAYIIKNSKQVWARDNLSVDVVREIASIDAVQTIDVAFAIDVANVTHSSEKVKIGINPSGLLWNGGYTKDNQFNLKVNYRDYLRSIIKELLKNPNNSVYLIPHVASNDLGSADNDMVACKALCDEFSGLQLSPQYDDPISVKKLIASMDAFSGARMHATIAAFTKGIPVLPFSYSRKFEGLYQSMGYPYIVSGVSLTTEQAISKTLEFFNKYDAVDMTKYSPIIESGIDEMKNRVIGVLKKVK